MSRVGKQPIALPGGVDAQVQPGNVQVKGPKGILQIPVHASVEVRRDGDRLFIACSRPEDRQAKAAWGLTRALLANAIEGVCKGYERRLVVVGVGFRAELKGKNLELQLQYSHPVTVQPEPGIEFAIDAAPSGIDGAQASIVVRGADKELVGRTTANIRAVLPPEPYKGKGIRYFNEYVKRKAGKTAV